jgi:hypothetical protein
MARQKVTDEIDALRRKKEELDARLKAALDRQKEHERQQDERRKLLAGALALKHMAAHPDSEFARTLAGLLDKHVMRVADRALFPSLGVFDERIVG